jgi:gamma-glutamyltranspeptidase / glutathione hydrolase
VMAPAIALARDGFTVSPLLSRTITSSAAKLGGDSLALARFMPGGEALQPGDRLVQPELAATLELIARGGAPAFYEGDVARRLAAKVTAAGGLITERDMHEYRVIDRRPLCGQVMGHTVLTAPPTLSGMTVLEALGIFERAVRTHGGTLAESPAAAVALVDALRIADADRARWRGDPGAAPVPARGIASAAFAAERAALVGSAIDTVPAGDPWDEDAQAPTPACAALDPFPASARPALGNGDAGAPESESLTSHLAVVDADRNAVSMTFTVGVLFGSGVYTDGFFLNSAGTNFDSRTAAPNRRNNSTMSPTILLDGDDVRLVVGAAGSAYIPPAVVQTIVQVAHYGRDLGDAVAAPRLSPSRRREVEIEPGWSPSVYAALRAAGFATRTRVADLAFGGVHAVQVRSDGRLVGAADPRRDGAAAGY